MKITPPSVWLPPSTGTPNLPLISTGNGSGVKWGARPITNGTSGSGGTGSQGSQGYQGSQGSQGGTGSQGPQGYQGASGGGGGGGSANIWHKVLSSGSLGASGADVYIGDLGPVTGYNNYYVIATCVMIGKPYTSTYATGKLTLDTGGVGSFNGSSTIAATVNIPFQDNGTGSSFIMNTECVIASVCNAPSTSSSLDIYAYANINSGSVFSVQQGVLTIIGIN